MGRTERKVPSITIRLPVLFWKLRVLQYHLLIMPKRSRSFSVPRGRSLKRRNAMPYSKDYTAYAAKSSQNTVSTAVAISRFSSRVIPKTSTVTMRYFSQSPVNPVGGGSAGHAFCANSCFDPDQTGPGISQWAKINGSLSMTRHS